MPRKRITQVFPWLWPLRKKQRLFCFYIGMCLDKNRYANSKSAALLPYKMFEASFSLYNHETGFDMLYQENKVFNLQLAAQTLDLLLIRPYETFSFWKLVQLADKQIPYKDGLLLSDGKLIISPGGGLCQMSNLLFWMFLHSPLTIVERHPHAIKDFPTSPSDTPEGVDATISEGWLDLKVKNETKQTFGLHIAFDKQNIIGSIFADSLTPFYYEIEGRNLLYFRKNNTILEKISIFRDQISLTTNEKVSSTLLYINLCEVGYSLPNEIPIIKISDKECIDFGAPRI